MLRTELVVGGIVAWLVATLGTAVVLWIVRRSRRLVEPSARGAHSTPMPTGGGLGIVAGFAVGHLVIDLPLFALWWAALGILLLALIDDVVRPLSALEKTVLLVGAAACFLVGVPAQPLPIGEWVVDSGGMIWFGIGMAWFFGLCNAFNFMDGIDGLGTTQSMCIAGWLAFNVVPFSVDLAAQACLFAAALAGFLLFNKPPARIFMGDVGSLFCGFTVAALAFLAVGAGMSPLHVFALLAYYLFDTSYTLLRRLINGENPLHAHNKHLYQRLCRMGWSHGAVCLWAGCMTLLNGLGAHCAVSGQMLWAFLCWGIAATFLLGVVFVIEQRGPRFA